ncbi:unnamed protein product [Closterium sp. NIES-53]
MPCAPLARPATCMPRTPCCSARLAALPRCLCVAHALPANCPRCLRCHPGLCAILLPCPCCLVLPPALLLPPVLLLLRCCCAAVAAAAAACATAGPAEPPCRAAFAAPLAAATAAMANPAVLTFDAEGHPIQFESWLEGLHQYLKSVTQTNVSLFEHSSGSLLAPEAPAEPAADAGEEVQMQFRAAHVAYKRWMARDAAATLAPLTFSALSEFASVADVGGGSGAGKSGGGGQQQLESSCVAARAPTSKGAVPAEALLSVPVALDDPTPGLVYAHPFESSGSTEGGDPGAADSATSCRSPRLEAPPGFPPRTSSPPLQPVAMDFGGPCVFGEGDAEGAGFGGTGYGGVDSGGARCPLVGGVGGTGARGVPGTGGPSVCARGAGSVGASQTLPWRPIFLEQPSSSLLESALHHLLRLPTALTSLVFSSCRS